MELKTGKCQTCHINRAGMDLFEFLPTVLTEFELQIVFLGCELDHGFVDDIGCTFEIRDEGEKLEDIVIKVATFI
jgi:hypothetical protein